MRSTADSLALGPWRRRRRMARKLAELDRLDLEYRLAGGDARTVLHPIGAPLPGYGRRPRPLAAALKVVVVLAVLVGATSALLRSEYGVTIGLDGVDGPERLLDPVADTGPGGSHSFTMEDRGRPVTYNPCERIDIVVNDAIAPPGASQLVHEAIVEVSAASGLDLRVVGSTDELPAEHRDNRQPGRYGDRWAPVLLAWTTPSQDPRIDGDVAGIGGSVAVSSGMSGELRYVTGIVVLDAPQFQEILNQDTGWGNARAIVMHELAHLVGLGHVDDPAELMAEENDGLTAFGTGDRQGLSVVGSGSCF